VYSVSANFRFKCENSNAREIQQIYLIAYRLELTVMSVARLSQSVDDRGMRFRFPTGGEEIFLFTITHSSALEPTQPAIQWVPLALSTGTKRQER
jgi:hypothetical protein